MIAKWLGKNTWKISSQSAHATVVIALSMIFFVIPMNGLSQPEAQNKRFPEKHGEIAHGTENEEMQTSDNPPAQFELEALILEVSGETDLAIENLEKNGGGPGASFAECESITIEGKRYLDLDTALQGLLNLPGVKILSTPKMVTVDNKTATMKRGVDGAEDFEGMKSLLLEITPQFLEDGRINQRIYLKAITRSDGMDSLLEAVTEAATSREGMILAISFPLTYSPRVATRGEFTGKYFLILITSKEIDESS